MPGQRQTYGPHHRHVADAQFYLASGPTIVSKYVGDSEETLRMTFAAAQADKRAIIFLMRSTDCVLAREQRYQWRRQALAAQLLT